MMKYLFFFFLILIFFSCNQYEEVKKENLPSAFTMNSSPTFKGYYYQGTDKSYHYFIEKWSPGIDRYFKIHDCRLDVFKPFKIGAKKEIRIDVFISDCDKFAENEYYSLYITSCK
jgi:hypothetical protein